MSTDDLDLQSLSSDVLMKINGTDPARAAELSEKFLKGVGSTSFVAVRNIHRLSLKKDDPVEYFTSLLTKLVPDLLEPEAMAFYTHIEFEAEEKAAAAASKGATKGGARKRTVSNRDLADAKRQKTLDEREEKITAAIEPVVDWASW